MKYIKIDLLAQLSTVTNKDDVLEELGVYVSDVDVELARRAIKAIGKVVWWQWWWWWSLIEWW